MPECVPLWGALQCLAFLVPTASSVAVVREGKEGDDMVPLQLDLPPDVQRMFEEMCELEGISQSEMLTRWIDARWDAMGYDDTDFEAYEASLAADASGDTPGRSVAANKKAEGSTTTGGDIDGGGLSSRGSAAVGLGSGVPGSPVRTASMPATTGSERASASTADANSVGRTSAAQKGRPSDGAGKLAGASSRPVDDSIGSPNGDIRHADGNGKRSASKDRAAGGGSGRPAGGRGRPAGGPGKPAGGQDRPAGGPNKPTGGRGRPAGGKPAGPARPDSSSVASGSSMHIDEEVQNVRRTGEGATVASRSSAQNEVEEEDEEEEEDEGMLDLDAWMKRHGDEE